MLITEDHVEALEKCLSLFAELCEKSTANTTAYNFALNALRKLADRGSIDAAHKAVKLFSDMEGKGIKQNEVSYSTVLSALTKPIELGDILCRETAREILIGRLANVTDDAGTFASCCNNVLNAMSRRYRAILKMMNEKTAGEFGSFASVVEDASRTRMCFNEIVENMVRVSAEKEVSTWGPSVQTYSNVMRLLAADAQSEQGLNTCLNLFDDLREQESMKVNNCLCCTSQVLCF